MIETYGAVGGDPLARRIRLCGWCKVTLNKRVAVVLAGLAMAMLLLAPLPFALTSAPANDDDDEAGAGMGMPWGEGEFLPSETKRDILPDAPELPPNANGPQCLPRTCQRSKHFTYKYQTLADPKAFTLLVSFPGSGNTFIRSVIEEGTRVYTGSMYRDKALKDTYHFEGELADPWTAHPTMSVIKSHFPTYHNIFGPVNHKVSGAIYILRSPWDAMYSEFNRQFAGNSHVGLASMELIKSRFFSWAGGKHKEWMSSANIWTGGYRNVTLQSEGDITKYFVANRPMRPNNQHPIPVLVLFYEDFVRDFEATARVLFRFLKARLGDAMPTVDDAVACAVAGQRRESSAQRSKKHPGRARYNPWQEQTEKFTADVIATWCAQFAPYWTSKWGRCEDAALQVDRRLSKRTPHQVHGLCNKPADE